MVKKNDEKKEGFAMNLKRIYFLFLCLLSSEAVVLCMNPIGDEEEEEEVVQEATQPSKRKRTGEEKEKEKEKEVESGQFKKGRFEEEPQPIESKIPSLQQLAKPLALESIRYELQSAPYGELQKKVGESGIAAIKQLITEYVDRMGNTLLHLAENAQEVENLLSLGADPEKLSYFDEGALAKLIHDGKDENTILKLISKLDFTQFREAASTGAKNWDAIDYAIIAKLPNVVKSLLNRAISPLYLSKELVSKLRRAHKHLPEIIPDLLENISPDFVDNKKHPFLLNVSQFLDVKDIKDIWEKIITLGDSLKKKKNSTTLNDFYLNDQNGNTPLFVAVKRNNLDLINYWVNEAKFNNAAMFTINDQNLNRETPLVVAFNALMNNPKKRTEIERTIKLLIDLGAHININMPIVLNDQARAYFASLNVVPIQLGQHEYLNIIDYLLLDTRPSESLKTYLKEKYLSKK